jgi:OMF family outer membrane factor
VYFALVLSSFAEKIVLTLDEAVETAKSKEKQIKQAEVNLENFKLQKDEAFKTALPKVSYSGTYGRLEDVDDASNQYYLQVTQPIFNGFRIKTAIENSDKYLDLGSLAVENSKNQVGIGVIEDYVNIKKLNRQLEILQNSQKVLKENQTRIKRLYELGMVAKTDVLNINQSLIEVETSVIQLENAIELSQIQLKNSLGIDINQEIELQEIENMEVDVASIDVDADTQRAKENNVVVQMQKINTDLTRASEVVSRADLLPSVNLSAQYGNLSTVMGEVSDAFKDENMSWMVGVNISGTLFSWGQKVDAYNRAKNTTLNAEYDEKIVQESIELGIKSAYLELIRLEKLKEARNKALESSKENFRLQSKSYENQLITSTDFLNAENELRQAEISLMETELELFYAYHNYLTLIK